MKRGSAFFASLLAICAVLVLVAEADAWDSPSYQAAQTCCKGCSYDSGCCCAARDVIPVTVTRYASTGTRTVTETLTARRRLAARSNEDQSIQAANSDDAVLSEFVAASGDGSAKVLGLERRHVCPRCPSGVTFSAGRTNGHVTWCCPRRKTVTHTVPRTVYVTKTRTVKRTLATVRGFAFTDNNGDKKYNNPPDLPLANTLLIFTVAGRKRALPGEIGQTMTNGLGRFLVTFASLPAGTTVNIINAATGKIVFSFTVDASGGYTGLLFVAVAGSSQITKKIRTTSKKVVLTTKQVVKTTKQVVKTTKQVVTTTKKAVTTTKIFVPPPTKIKTTTAFASGIPIKARHIVARENADRDFKRVLARRDMSLIEKVPTEIPFLLRTANDRIAIVSYVVETGAKSYMSLADYRAIEPLTTHSMRTYAERHGYAFHLATMAKPDSDRQGYWEKIGLIRSFLDKGYDWVVYSDVDVLFLDHTKKIQEFLVDKDVITVGECTHNGPEGRNGTNNVARSGFMILRNSARSRAFLDLWESSYDLYKNIENPEQSSLEAIQGADDWKDHVHLHDWSAFHSYSTCDRAFDAWSMHFPGHAKVERVAAAYLLLAFSGMPEWMWARDPVLVEHAAAIVRDKFSTYRVRDPAPPGADPWEPTETHVALVQSCLDKAVEAGYKGAASKYDRAFHRYVQFYLLASFRHNLPTLIFFTVPDKDVLPAKISANIESWIEMNPHHRVVLHDDHDAERMVKLLFPAIYAKWQELLPVQRADIYRYIVTGVLGGVYGDADTACKKPISEWQHHSDDAFVAGIEAQNVSPGKGPRHEGLRTVQLTQYVFGSAAFQPLMMDLLERLESNIGKAVAAAKPDASIVERLHGVLSTTGPVAFTDAFAKYICYAAPERKFNPDDFWLGGHAPGAHVFPVSGFGAGQQHSQSPAADSPAVLVQHKFGGSVALRGTSWVAGNQAGK